MTGDIQPTPSRCGAFLTGTARVGRYVVGSFAVPAVDRGVPNVFVSTVIAGYADGALLYRPLFTFEVGAARAMRLRLLLRARHLTRTEDKRRRGRMPWVSGRYVPFEVLAQRTPWGIPASLVNALQ